MILLYLVLLLAHLNKFPILQQYLSFVELQLLLQVLDILLEVGGILHGLLLLLSTLLVTQDALLFLDG